VKQYLYGVLGVLSVSPKVQSLVYSLLLFITVVLIARSLRKVPLRV
jgi:hypothetical protein